MVRGAGACARRQSALETSATSVRKHASSDFIVFHSCKMQADRLPRQAWTNIDIGDIETKRAFCDMSQVLRQSDPGWLRSETHMECESRWAGRHRHPTPANRRHPHHTGDRSHRNPAQIRCRCYTTTRRHAPRQPRRGRARRTGCAGTAARAVASAQAFCSAVGCKVFRRSGEREERGKSKVPNENLELGLGT
jgi:hypothetical protein